MNTDEQALQLLTALAARLRTDPQFMAHTLAVYQRQRGLDDAGLAAELGAAPEMLLRLALCRRPAPDAPAFAEQVRALADYTLLDETRLLRVIRRVEELNESAARAQAVPFWSWFRGLAAQPALAFAACFLLAALLGWLVWRAERATPAPPSAQQPQPAAPSATASVTPAPANEQLAVHTPPATSYEIDLEDWAAQREVETVVKQQPVIIRPPLERVLLRLRLLESSSRGSYRVSIASADGKLLKTRQAYSRDGVRLPVLLNLSRLAPGSYGLRVGRDGAAYVECRLQIVNPKAKSR